MIDTRAIHDFYVIMKSNCPTKHFVGDILILKPDCECIIHHNGDPIPTITLEEI